MANTKRGRPVGSSPHKDADEIVLRKAAVLLLTRHAANPTQAIREVSRDAEDHVIRRLQRRWRREGNRLIADLQTPMQAQRWEGDLIALKNAAPGVYARIKAFAESEDGSQVLTERLSGQLLAQMMSLGVVRLWELVEEHSPIGASAADRAFANALDSWSRFGATPDAAFLRRFAECCLRVADDLDKARGSRLSKSASNGDAS